MVKLSVRPGYPAGDVPHEHNLISFTDIFIFALQVTFCILLVDVIVLCQLSAANGLE